MHRILSIFIFCLIIERILSSHNWQNMSSVIKPWGNSRLANEDEIEYLNSFPLVRSYDLRKLFPYVLELREIMMVFLKLPPSWVKSLNPKQCIYLQISYQKKLRILKTKFLRQLILFKSLDIYYYNWKPLFSCW